MNFLILLGILLFIIGLAAFSYLIYTNLEDKKFIQRIFDLETTSNNLIESTETEESPFQIKLHRAGITKKEFVEVRMAGLFISFLMLFLIIYMNEDLEINIMLGAIGLFSGTYFPTLYLDEMYKARVERIDSDLSTFLDMIIIFLEAGSGLNNAMLEVTKRTSEVIGKDLLSEINRFVLEAATLPSDVVF